MNLEPQSDSKESISLSRLLWIRFVLLVALLLTAGVIQFGFSSQSHSPFLFIALIAGFLADPLIRHEISHGRVSMRSAMCLLVIYDVILLSIALVVSGGAANPFSTLLLVYVVVSASLLGSWWGAIVFLICASCYGALFSLTSFTDMHTLHSASANMSDHLMGMWFSFVVTGGLISLFVASLTGRLQILEKRLLESERRAERMERLGIISSLAANAAHELSTPLNTIALAAESLTNNEEIKGDSEYISDARLICEQVGRCKAILAQLAAKGGQSSGESFKNITVGAFAGLLKRELAHFGGTNINVSVSGENLSFQLPIDNILRAILNLIRNSIDAAGDLKPIEVSIDTPSDELRVRVIDSGPGFAPEHATKVCDPFFTTKKTDSHLGLGLFLVSQLAEQLGGNFKLEPNPGGGAIATLQVPRHPIARMKVFKHTDFLAAA